LLYTVQFTLAIMVAGFLLGCALSKPAVQLASPRLAHWYYRSVIVLLILGYPAAVANILFGQHRLLTTVSVVSGIAGSLLFGGIWGISVRRERPRELLAQPAILDALRMSVAFTFAIAGIGKAFNMTFMTEFFTQSGYSVTFLNFIMIGEVMGAVAFLLPWSFLPALAAFSIDMFGAIATHVHNHDPINDSAGAIILLVRLAAIGVVWHLQSEATNIRFGWGRTIARVASAGALCACVAIIGSSVLRHHAP
jgi:uncharacterized membrane protein YphA (DoxX/SURF4 family)